MILGGIFVGGAAQRMGGAPKGLLRAPDGQTIVARAARAMRDAGVEPVLVGRRDEYDALGLRVIGDAMPASGPLGGLVALLEAARGQPVIAIACDMPYVTAALIRKLANAPDAVAAVAPRREGRWEPLFARYDSARVLERARARCRRGELALQGLLDEVGAMALDLTGDEAAALADWDTPSDAVIANPSLLASTAPRRILTFHADGPTERSDRVAVEEPLEIRCSQKPVAVTMRTPGADVDLAVGFLLGEGVVRCRADVISVSPAGPSAVDVVLGEDARSRLPHAERTFFSTSSCGLCGKSSLDRVRAQLGEPLQDATRVDGQTILSMPAALRATQSLFDSTGGMHAAGLVSLAGERELMRFAEDVGRHNAVDKVLGAELLAGHVPLAGHALVLSGRIAFELVQKAALAGVAFVIAIGAPTSLAVELAESAGITLIGFARDGRFNVYAGTARVAAR